LLQIPNTSEKNKPAMLRQVLLVACTAGAAAFSPAALLTKGSSRSASGISGEKPAQRRFLFGSSTLHQRRICKRPVVTARRKRWRAVRWHALAGWAACGRIVGSPRNFRRSAAAEELNITNTPRKQQRSPGWVGDTM